ncbi:MAG: rhamnulokinase [Ruminococcus sp.]|nr:rhamnulokinase [Ruminococcus sp.]
MRHVLAFDFGGGSGRAVLAHFDGSKIELEEIHRFDNEPVMVQGHLYWDILRLFHELKTGLVRAKHICEVECIGIDTWGVDYGLLDSSGLLLGCPFHYRDTKNNGYAEKSAAVMKPETLYAETGTQIMDINTLFQLLSAYDIQPKALEMAEIMLPLPDLFAYFLTDVKTCERSIASTTSLMNVRCGRWSDIVPKAFSIPKTLLPPIVDSATIKGVLSPSICDELETDPIPVAAVCGHDTQCAAFAVPSKPGQDVIFISCGTWSLFGTELDEPVLSEESARLGLSNEVGHDGKITYLKNIIGLWLIQETRRYLRSSGEDYTYAELEELALNAEPLQYFIDPDDPVFTPPGNIPQRVQDYCVRTGQGKPGSLGSIVRCIYESLALKYRMALEEIRTCTRKEFSAIHMLGGGTKDRLLCQMTADVCNLPVYAGPKEATVYGNAAMQLMAIGAIVSREYAKNVIAASEPVLHYFPREDWFDAYTRFKEIIQKKSESE